MLLTCSPFRSEVHRLRQEMDRLFGASAAEPASYPALNVWEDGERLYVEAEVPGLDPSRWEIVVTAGNRLSIQGERSAPTVEGGTWHRRERGVGKFARVLELPQSVDPSRVEAEYKLGVLTIVLPKRDEAKARRIEVRGA